MYGLSRLSSCIYSINTSVNRCWGNRMTALWRPLGGRVPSAVPRIVTRSSFFGPKARKIRPRYAADQVCKESFQIIYENNMNNLLFWGQLVINTLTIPVVLYCGYIIVKFRADIPDRLRISHPALGAMFYSVFGVFILALLGAVWRRNLIRIYHNAETGEFVGFTRNFLMQKKRLEFSALDVSPKEASPVTGFGSGNITVKGRPFLVAGKDFTVPAYYNMFRGHDLGRELETVPDYDFSDEAAELKRRIRSKFGRK